jgi:hypothetical protein
MPNSPHIHNISLWRLLRLETQSSVGFVTAPTAVLMYTTKKIRAQTVIFWSTGIGIEIQSIPAECAVWSKKMRPDAVELGHAATNLSQRGSNWENSRLKGRQVFQGYLTIIHQLEAVPECHVHATEPNTKDECVKKARRNNAHEKARTVVRGVPFVVVGPPVGKLVGITNFILIPRLFRSAAAKDCTVRMAPNASVECVCA